MSEAPGGPRFCPMCARPLVQEERDGRLRRVCPSAGCGYVHWDNPVPVVAALVEHEGEVLLARNRAWPEGWYGLITGFLERGEAPEAAVLREVREELNLEGEIEALIGVYAFPEQNQVILAYHVRARGEIRLGEELVDYKRIPPERLRPWGIGTGLAVRDWLKKRGLLRP